MSETVTKRTERQRYAKAEFVDTVKFVCVCARASTRSAKIFADSV